MRESNSIQCSGHMRVLLFALLILFATAATVMIWPNDVQPLLYHHADGHFSLNSKRSCTVSKSDLRDYLQRFRKFGRMRLVASDTTLLSEFGRMLDVSCESGVGRYRLESGELAFSFHVPGCGYETENECKAPEIIDLSRGRVQLVPEDPKFDIVIIASSDIPCRELLATASGYKAKGKSIALIAKAESSKSLDFCLLHDRNGETDMGEFKLRQPYFYERQIQPHIETLRDWFD